MTPFFNSLAVAMVGIVLAFLSAWFWFQRGQAIKERDEKTTEHRLLMGRVNELETKERLAAAAWVPIASAFQAALIKSLTHAHTGELDDLLLKVAEGGLLPSEEPRMLVLLDERTRDMDHRFSEGEKDGASIFPVVMKMAKAERALLVAAEEAKMRPGIERARALDAAAIVARHRRPAQ